MGIGLPWLVRDWLNAKSDVASAGPIAISFPSWSERIRAKFSGSDDEAQSESEPGPLAESSEREPYPLASQTRRIMEGFLGGADGREVKGLRSFFPGEPAPPSTARSLAITEDTAAKLNVELAPHGLKCGDPVVLRAFKEEAELEIWMKRAGEPLYVLFKVHRLAAPAGQEGPKLREGDGQVPEGFYGATAATMRPETRHHLGIDLGYPNDYDLYQGRTGSEMMIHAGPGAAGAIALAAAAMNEVYTLTDAAFRAGEDVVPIHLFPFRLTDARMDRVLEGRSRWTEEWVNLKEGYDFFENVRLPPRVGVENGRYAFHIAEREN